MKAWLEHLQKLESTFGKETIDQWLRSIKIHRFDAANLYLDVASSFQILWYQEHIKEPVHDQNGKTIRLHFLINGKPWQSLKKKKKIEPATAPQYFSADHLSSHATFEHFLLDESPFLPFDLLSNIDGSYNPIYLYGKEGTGKTHLLMATAHALLKQKKKVFYVHSETFSEHVIRAFRTGSLQTFRSTYRELECLIIDDVHLLRRKTTTQEELFHTFNRLHTQGMQMIFSSHTTPSQLEAIEDRLKSRFEWGITLPLKPLSKPNQVKVLDSRARMLSLNFTPLLMAFLIETFSTLPSQIRALEALALRLHQTSLSLDISTAQHLLKDLIAEETQETLSSEKIIQAVSRVCQTKAEDILGRSQSKECLLPRKIAMYLIRERLRLPYEEIGRFFTRDHSTVMTSIKQIQTKKMEKQKEVGRLLFEIENLI